jgi:uncharacterized membrane protein
MNDTLWIILWAAVLTYMTRIGGHLVLSRFERIPPRVEAGLNAVPAAVLTAMVAPAILGGGAVELTALGVAAIISLRGGMFPAFFGGSAVLLVGRWLF